MNLSNKYIFDGQFGLERETLRVTSDGALSKTPHPFLGSEHFDRDFCENQLELITPPCDSISSLMNSLYSLGRNVRATLLAQNEFLWLNSNPPHIQSSDDIQIANFCDDQLYKYEYRVKLEKKYGKRLMLYSGIHFNFSFSEQFLRSIHKDDTGYYDFTNAFYFRLSKQLSRYSWLPVMLTAASPVYDLSLDGDGLLGSGFDGYSSRRNGEKGYWNKFVPILDYTDLDTYIRSIGEYIDKGMLISSSELYIPIRLKTTQNNMIDHICECIVDHIELRMFDVNPLSPVGVFKEDLEFTHYFLIYLSSLPDFVYTPDLQRTAIENHKAAASYDLSSVFIDGCPAYDAAKRILDDMKEYFRDFKNVLDIIDFQYKKIASDKRYCVEIYSLLHKDFHGEMLKLIKNQA